jgi:hypothetical protein
VEVGGGRAADAAGAGGEDEVHHGHASGAVGDGVGREAPGRGRHGAAARVPMLLLHLDELCSPYSCS